MHRVAEEGIASHWKYKEGIQAPAEETQFGWLRRVLEWQKEVKDPHQFLSNLKIDLYPREVYIFTPKGEVMTLSKGSTPVDFAYAIHTEIGHRCLGAKINGRLLPLKSRLKNGDRVEILTSNQSRPRRGWLEFVKTSKARHAIRHWLTQRQREHAEILGKKLYEKEARKYEISPKRYRKKLKELLPTWNFKEPEDLYAALGFGKLPASVVIKQLAPERTIRQPKGEESRLEKVVRRVLGRQDDGILVQGESDLMVSRAKCCNAIRGEEIIGYITVGRGISVHALTCRNVENLLLNPERTIEVEWASDTEEDRYAVPLRIYTEDRRGMLADISNAISNIKTNIVNATADTVEGRFGLFDLTVEVTDTAHLDRVVNVIKDIEGVRDVDRAGNRAREVGA
jgi:GTP pyrophosphokinase